jgi:hypothetical protein
MIFNLDTCLQICFLLHKKEIVCEKRRWEDFVTEFRANHPDIDSSLINNCYDLDHFETDSPRLHDIYTERMLKGNENVNKLPNESGILEDEEAKVEDQNRDCNIIKGIIERDWDKIGNDEETRTSETAEQADELSDEEILSFLRANDLTEKEMNWLKSKGTLTESEVLKLIGQILLER